MAKLILFDIDGTLIDTGRAGGGALLDAVETLFAVSRQDLPPLQLAGATDGGIVRQLFSRVGQVYGAEAFQRYIDCYLSHLRSRLEHADFNGRTLPGVGSLLQALAADGRADLGLLTGNVRAGAELKLRRFSLETYFMEGAFGDDAENRDLLGPIAMQRMSQQTGRSYEPGQVIVIGDTPKDISCAHACGARSVAVSTGQFSMAELQTHQAWQVLPDLADTQAVCDLLLS
jgi:phosphoglycolate phosphatase